MTDVLGVTLSEFVAQVGAVDPMCYSLRRMSVVNECAQVEWDGKDASFDQDALQLLKDNDITVRRRVRLCLFTCMCDRCQGLRNLKDISFESLDVSVLSVGRQGFIRNIFKAFAEQFPPEPAPIAEHEPVFASGASWTALFCALAVLLQCAGQSPNELLQGMLLGMIGKPHKQWVNVNLGKELQEQGLGDHFPVEAGSACTTAAAVGMRVSCVSLLLGLALDKCGPQDRHEDKGQDGQRRRKCLRLHGDQRVLTGLLSRPCASCARRLR